jgi:hypothetical protein
VRKLKSMDGDCICLFLEVARTGRGVNRQHKDVDRASEVIHCFALRKSDYCTTGTYQAVQKG